MTVREVPRIYPYIVGTLAFLSRESCFANPYNRYSTEFQRWMEGWNDAECGFTELTKAEKEYWEDYGIKIPLRTLP